VRHPRATPQAPLRSGRPLTRLLDAPFLDRLVRGRTWIALVASALLGIVAMQVTILRLGTTIGRSVNEIQQLTQQNESAETRIAALEPGRDVASEAASLGMVYPPAGDVEYLRYRPGDASRAASLAGPPTVPSIAPAPASLTESLTPSAPVTAPSTSTDSTTTAPATTPTPSTTAPPSNTATTTASGGATGAPGAPTDASSGSSPSGGAVG
jgi:cytoskeletal protein RodZ